MAYGQERFVCLAPSRLLLALLFEDVPQFAPASAAPWATTCSLLEDATRRIKRYLKSRGLLRGDDDETAGALTPPEGAEARALAELAATTMSGMTPPGGPAWKRPGRRMAFQTLRSEGLCEIPDSWT